MLWWAFLVPLYPGDKQTAHKCWFCPWATESSWIGFSNTPLWGFVCLFVCLSLHVYSRSHPCQAPLLRRATVGCGSLDRSHGSAKQDSAAAVCLKASSPLLLGLLCPPLCVRGITTGACDWIHRGVIIPKGRPLTAASSLNIIMSIQWSTEVDFLQK